MNISTSYANIIENFNFKNITIEDGLSQSTVKTIYQDIKGYIWVGTDKGLVELDKNLNLIKSYEDTIGEVEVYNIYDDLKGNLWVCTLGNGLFRINLNDKSIKNYKNSRSASSILSNNIRDVISNSSGDSIYGIYKDDDNLLWLGTSEQGINIINEKEVKYLHTENSNLLSNTIIDITGYKNKVFIGTNNSLSVLIKDNENYTITNYTEKEGLPSNKITYLFVDSKGALFIGTRNGLAILDSNNKLIDITYILDDIGISDKFIGAIYEDSKENYYIGCFLGGGLIKINPNTKKYKIYKNIDNDETSLSNDCIIFINEDLDGNILVGTSYGLNILDVNKDTFKRYTEKDGLINNTIYGILVDDSNKIWISTNEGISALCTKKNDFENFTIIDGLQSNEFNGRSCFKDNNGNMYFGCINGFNTFNPDNIEISQFKPNIILDSVQVNGVNRKDISNTKLKHNEHNIKINFFTNDYTLIFDTDVEEKIVRCGKTEIERCIINLVGNAVKFTPEGGLIEVTIKDLDDKVQISVKDNGIGISEENTKLIFDRFNQVVDENAEVKGGSGLGLTISKQLITLHGGHIYVESEVGIGSEFIIILPANNH